MQNIIEEKIDFKTAVERVHAIHGAVGADLYLTLRTAHNVLYDIRDIKDRTDAHEILFKQMKEIVDRLDQCIAVLDSTIQNVDLDGDANADAHPQVIEHDKKRANNDANSGLVPTGLAPEHDEKEDSKPFAQIVVPVKQQQNQRINKLDTDGDPYESDQEPNNENQLMRSTACHQGDDRDVEAQEQHISRAEQIKLSQEKLASLQQEMQKFLDMPSRQHNGIKDIGEKEELRLVELVLMSLFQIDSRIYRTSRLVETGSMGLAYDHIVSFLIDKGPARVSCLIKACLLVFSFGRMGSSSDWMDIVQELMLQWTKISNQITRMDPRNAIPKMNPTWPRGFTYIFQLLCKAVPEDKHHAHPLIQFIKNCASDRYQVGIGVGVQDHKDRALCQAKHVYTAIKTIENERETNLGLKDWQEYIEIVRAGAIRGLADAQSVWATLISQEQPDEAGCWYQRAIRQGCYHALECYALFVGLSKKQFRGIAFNLSQNKTLSDSKEDHNPNIKFKHVDFATGKDAKENPSIEKLRAQFQGFYEEMLRIPLRYRFLFESDAEFTQLLRTMGVSDEYILNSAYVPLSNESDPDHDDDDYDTADDDDDDDECNQRRSALIAQ